MPLINNLIQYTEEQKNLINDKLSDANFNHNHWGNEDLQEIRSAIRQHYRNEQVAKCAFCYNNVSLVAAHNAHVEHIAPKSLHRNFMFEVKNLCVICADCNTIKRDQEVLSEIPETINNPEGRVSYPRSSGAFKIVHPHFDNYEDHIIKRGKAYIDRTDKGVFTISACKLNRFFHKFGFDDDFINDDTLITLMNSFIHSKSTRKRNEALESLKEIMMFI